MKASFRCWDCRRVSHFLVAITDLDQADLADPAFLEQLAAASIKITLAEGEKKKQDLKLSGGG